MNDTNGYKVVRAWTAVVLTALGLLLGVVGGVFFQGQRLGGLMSDVRSQTEAVERLANALDRHAIRPWHDEAGLAITQMQVEHATMLKMLSTHMDAGEQHETDKQKRHRIREEIQIHKARGD